MTPEMIRRALRKGRSPARSRRCSPARRSRTRACRRSSTRSSTTCRARSTSRPCRGSTRSRRRRRPAARLRRAVRGARVQGHERPVRREAHVLPRLLGPGQGRRPRAQHDERQDRADRAHPPDAREPPRGARGDRRGEIAAAVGLKFTTTGDTIAVDSAPIVLESMSFPIRSSRSRSSRDEGRPGQARDGAPAPRRGGSDLPRLVGRGDRADAHRGDGRAAPRDHRRPPQREFSVDGNVGRPQVAYRETITSRPRRSRAGSSARPAARASTATSSSTSTRTRRGLRVRGQDRRREDPEGVHPRRRPGHPGGDELGHPRRLPRRRRQGSSWSTARTTRSTRASAPSRSPARWRSRRA